MGGFEKHLKMDSMPDIPIWKKQFQSLRFVVDRERDTVESNPIYLENSSIDDSEIFYRENGILLALCTNDAGFWSLVKSQAWRTILRVGGGKLQRRLLHAIDILLEENVLKQYETVRTYAKCSFGENVEEFWIPDHKIGNDKTAKHEVTSYKVCQNETRTGTTALYVAGTVTGKTALYDQLYVVSLINLYRTLP